MSEYQEWKFFSKQSRKIRLFFQLLYQSFQGQREFLRAAVLITLSKSKDILGFPSGEFDIMEDLVVRTISEEFIFSLKRDVGVYTQRCYHKPKKALSVLKRWLRGVEVGWLVAHEYSFLAGFLRAAGRTVWTGWESFAVVAAAAAAAAGKLET